MMLSVCLISSSCQPHFSQGPLLRMTCLQQVQLALSSTELAVEQPQGAVKRLLAG